LVKILKFFIRDNSGKKEYRKTKIKGHNVEQTTATQKNSKNTEVLDCMGK